MRVERNNPFTARTKSRAMATKSIPMNGIGGPQTNAERPAEVAREIPQRLRISGADWRCLKHVSATSKLKVPHPTCVAVSIFWPAV